MSEHRYPTRSRAKLLRAASPAPAAAPPPPPLEPGPPFGTLSVLPAELLHRVLAFLPPSSTYLDLRLASRALRALAVAHLESRWRSSLASPDPTVLPDDLREIQAVARLHAVHARHWASPNPVTHRTETGGYGTDPLADCGPAPRPDVTHPPVAAAILRKCGFQPEAPGGVGMLVELAARLYATAWHHTEQGYSGTLARSRYRDRAMALVGEFDGCFGRRGMRALLELARPMWAPEGSGYGRRRDQDAASALVGFLGRFPKFVADAQGLEAVLRGCTGSGFTANQLWLTLAGVQRWSPEGSATHFARMLADAPAVGPEVVSRIVQQTVGAKRAGIHSTVTTGEDCALFAAARDALAGFATRANFPGEGGLVRLSHIAMLVSDTGAGFRRPGLGMERFAEMFAEIVAPCLDGEPVEEAAEELRRCTAAVREILHGTGGRVAPRVLGGAVRAYGSFAARLLDIFAALPPPDPDVPARGVARFRPADLFPAAAFTSDAIFHTVSQTDAWPALADLWRGNRPGGGAWSRPDFGTWRAQVMDLAPEVRKEVRRRLPLLQAALMGEEPRVRAVAQGRRGRR
ncbi:hypothetical protein DFJ74DRAFT_676341 [Hyaloraphidium curvatum]|nr:hypothetical protein DFJ74DRAFT_676341 [Hyaloraphidium curvatum]